MDPELQALFDRLASTDQPLTDEELTTLIDGLLAAYDEIDNAEGAPDLELLRQYADATEAARTEQATRAGAAEAAAAEAAEIRARMHPAESEGEESEEGEPAPPAAEGGEPAPVPAPDPVAAAAEPVTPPPAVRTPVGALAARAPAPRRPASPPTNVARAIVRAMVGRAGFASGQELTTGLDLGKLAAEALRTANSDTIIASMITKYPKDRMLSKEESAESLDAKIRAVTDHESIVAAGGTCLPVNVDYSLPVLGDTDRPVRDALPSFGADRGGLRFVAQPNFVGGSWANATALWTEANDVSPSAPTTKPVLSIVCGQEQLVYVDAIPTRVKIGNFMARFNPEQVEANLKLVGVAQARFAEINLLNKINANSTEIPTAKLLGVVRDLLANLDLLISQYRYRHRLNDTHSLRAILPMFAKDMMRADMARQLAVAGGGGYDPLAVTDAQIGAWFAARNVNVSWTIDPVALQAGAAGPPIRNAYGLQGWTAALVDGAAIQDWPATVVWWLFTEGDFVFLDGGRLDIGVVRDSTLNSTNDYQIFTEEFESIAFRGVEALRVVSTVRPNGQSSGTKDLSSY